MATSPIYAGGARRSAAPAYTPRAALTTGVNMADEELINQIVGNFAPASSINSQAAMPLSEAYGSGANIMSFGGGADLGGDAAGAGIEAGGGISPGQIGALGSGLSALGTLGQNAELGQIGGMLGLAGALGSAQTSGQALGIAGQAALGMAGVPGVGLAANAISGNVPGMVNSAISMANPVLGALNALSSIAGFGSIGGLANNISTALANDTDIGSQQTGMLAAQEQGFGLFGLGDSNTGTGVSTSGIEGGGTSISGTIGGESFGYSEAGTGDGSSVGAGDSSSDGSAGGSI